MGRLCLMCLPLVCMFLCATGIQGQCADGGSPQNENCTDVAGYCEAPDFSLPVPSRVVLLLGNTGVGKSTLARYLAGHDEELTAVEASPGTFLINGSLIGSSVHSMTSVPNSLQDANGVTFMDCPGFEDNRGPCADVNTTYYMKDILRKAKEVKILFLAPYYATATGQSRQEFLSMLFHAADILKDVEKYENAVGLVVTKVDLLLKVKKSYAAAPLTVLLNNIASFLEKDILPFLSGTEALTEKEKLLYERAHRLVKIFLSKEEERFVKIGIFRSPDEEGVLSEISVLQDEKAQLMDIVHKKVSFAPVDLKHFGYTVSAKTKSHVLYTAQKLDRLIGEGLKNFAIVAARRSESDNAVELRLQSLRSAYALDASAWEDLQRRVEARNDANGLAADIKGLSGSNNDEFVRLMERYSRQLDALQLISEETLRVSPYTWAAAINAERETFEIKRDWYSFLISLFEGLSRYDIQRSKRSYNVASIQNWGRSGFDDQGGILIYRNNLDVFLDKASSIAFWIKSRPVDYQMLHHLNVMLATALRHETSHSCDSGEVVIKGVFVMLSQEIGKIACRGDVRKIKVFALHTVFVESDVSLPSGVLAVVAPRWVVLGNRHISLDGWDGWKQDSGARDGDAGAPGGSGGAFLGVGQDFVSGKDLLVTADGGRGGRGRDGATGMHGMYRDGHGGNGGAGGVGGHGGLAGKVNILSVNGDSSGIRSRAVMGARGEPGAGGAGGPPKERSRREVAAPRRQKRELITILVLGAIAAIGGGAAYAALKPTPVTYTWGSHGRDGASTRNRRFPVLVQYSFAEVLPEYQVYLEHYLNDIALGTTLAGFQQHLRQTVVPPDANVRIWGEW